MCSSDLDTVILESTSPVGTTEQVRDFIADLRPDLKVPGRTGESPDVAIAYCPERVLPGRILVELIDNDRVIVTPSVQYNGTQASFVTSAASANFNRRVPGYAIANLYAEVRHPSQRAAAFVRISNLLDAGYYNAGTGTGSTFFSSPQEPRTVFGGVRMAF